MGSVTARKSTANSAYVTRTAAIYCTGLLHASLIGCNPCRLKCRKGDELPRNGLYSLCVNLVVVDRFDGGGE